MWKTLIILTAAAPSIVAAQAIAPGKWDVTSTAVELNIPGAPGFLLRMMKGRSKTEHKCVAPEQAKGGIAALLTPDPKARCRVDSVRVEGGQYAQVLSCPQKKGPPITISRSGSYDANGFTGHLQMAGSTPKGAMSIKLDQRAVHVTGTCRG